MAKLFGIYNNRKSSKDVKVLLNSMFQAFSFGKSDFAVHQNFGVGHIKIPTKNSKGIAEDRDLIVCFSGQIFEYEPEIKILKRKGYAFERMTPEHFILNAYKQYGLDFIKNLNGVFVFVIFEKHTKKVLIVNDRYAMRPIYYYADKDKIIFASEIKAILQDSSIKREIMWNFWKDYFAYGYGLGEKTPFKNIYAPENGSIITFKDGELSIQRYWDYDQIQINHKRNEDETVKQGVEIIKNVILRQTNGLKQCMILLSGGYDSRCIAASVKKYTKINFSTYTTQLHPSGNLDVIYAKMISERLGIKNYILGQPSQIYKKYFIEHLAITDSLTAEHYWVMPLIADISHEAVNIDGICGDVLLGAGWFSISSIADYRKSNHRLARNLHFKMIDDSATDYSNIAYIFNDKFKSVLTSDDQSVFKELSKIPKIENKTKIFHLKNGSKNAITLLASNIIMRRFYSIYPYCDNEFVEFAFTIPPKMKVKNDIYLKILKKAYPDIMKIPSTNDPHTFLERTRGYMKRLGVHKALEFAVYANKLIKKMIKSKSRRHKNLADNPKDVDYLIDLIKVVKIPKYFNRKKILHQLNFYIEQGIDPSGFLIPILQFCIWHEELLKGNTKKYKPMLKSHNNE